MRRLVPLLAAGLLAGALAGAADAKELRASSGNVSATVTWQQPNDLEASDVELTIVRAGATAFSSGMTLDGKETTFLPVGLKITDLDGNGELEVILDLYSGGAHCCTTSVVQQFDAVAAAYQTTAVHDWGNPGYRLENLDRAGPLEFVTGDDRFAYEFACYACSALPIQIWRYAPGGFDDVTRDFPRLVRKNAAGAWTDYRQALKRHEDVRGLLSAWAADKALVGKSAQAFRTLDRLAANGTLNGDSPWPSGKRYVRELRSFLTKTGYLPG